MDQRAAKTTKSAPQSMTEKPPYLGFGLGLRPQHYQDILEGQPDVEWFEVISENYMVPGGQPLKMLERIRERYPIVMHGVSLSIASTAPPNEKYLSDLKSLANRFEPVFVSDHLCWTGVHGVNLHDLLPIPYTREALDHVVNRIDYVQNYLGRAIALENVSSYVQFSHSEMTEWEFISEMTKRTGCWLVFDVNNVFVSSFNHELDASSFIEGVPAERIVQFHLAGHEHNTSHIVDTHDALVCDEVWDLYRAALRQFGAVSAIIERDDHIPPLSEMISELNIARKIANEELGTAPAADTQAAS